MPFSAGTRRSCGRLSQPARHVSSSISGCSGICKMDRPSAATVNDEGLAGLHPAYFALVMATGIVSIAAHLLEIPIVPKALFALNVVFYPALWGLTLARAWRH